jgi:hypothetical protein
MAGPADDNRMKGTPPRAPAVGASDGAPTNKPSVRPSIRPGGAKSLIGTTISDRYRIQKLLGEGGMGAVYQAEHTLMRKRMAVKVLHPEMTRLPEVVARFEREAMAAAHIDHPNVVTATDFVELGRALHIARQIASALQRAHSLKIVHRDLKPENVMLVERDGDTDFVKVLDFGIAKVQIGEFTEDRPGEPGQPILTQAGMVYGTPEYMAPEQALGQPVDARADLYALGIIMYEMFTGFRPFDAESKVALLGMQVTAPVPPMSTKAPEAQVPPEVEALTIRLLAKESAERTADAREVIDGITALLGQLAAAGRIDPRYQPPPASGLATNPGLISGISHVPLEPVKGIGTSDEPKKKPLAAVVDQIEKLIAGKQWIVAAAAGTFALLVLLVTILVVSKGSSTKADPQDAGVTVATVDAAPHDETPLDQKVKDAIALIDRGDYRSGIDALVALGSDVQDREDVHRALFKAYSQTEHFEDAMREIRLVLKANAKIDLTLDANTSIRIAVRDTALKEGSKEHKAAADAAFELLEGPMGSVGWDDLWDLAYPKGASSFPAAQRRAQGAIVHGDRSKMSDGLAVTADLIAASARGCGAVKGLLDRAVEKGDERTLTYMRSLTAPRIVGHWKKQDTLGCIHDREKTLDKAIASLEDRLSKKK